MQDHQDKIITALMEQLIEKGPEGMAAAFTAVFDLAMRTERDQHLHARPYERSAERRGYANGYKPKKVDTHAGTLPRHSQDPRLPRAVLPTVPGTRTTLVARRHAGHRRDAWPALGLDPRVQGVSTRDAEKVMAEFGLERLSSTQVSRAAALLDDELEAWRKRRLEPVRYLIVDARYEKVRDGGVVRDAAILSAIGISADGRRRLLGVSAARSEAECIGVTSRQPR